MRTHVAFAVGAAILVIGAATAFHCDSSGSVEPGTVTLELTDAPADDIVSAVVTIEEIYLQSEADGRIVLRDDPVTVDLVTLANDIETVVAAVGVPDGTYHQLRFVISAAYIAVAGERGTEYWATPGAESMIADAGGTLVGELKTPSWDASGLKVKLPDGQLVVASDARILVVDFDVARSFQTQTGSGDWVMSPVVDATDLALTTDIAVEVRLAPGAVLSLGLDEVAVELVDAAGVRAGLLLLADPDGDQQFSATFRYLDPRDGPFTARLLTPDGESLAIDALGGQNAITGQSGATVTVTLTIL